MHDRRQTIVVTGISGNLGTRLLPLLSGYNVVGVDMVEPATDRAMRFERVDIGRESACSSIVELLREVNASAVVHLAFVIDPVRTGVLDVHRMWQINVAGTARIMEAITEVNRHGGNVQKFIFPSSVSAYGSDLARPAVETSPLNAHTLPYAVQKRESDEVVQYRAAALGTCNTYILRPHIYAGASMQNYLVGALRGTPTGPGKIAARWRKQGLRLPLVLPYGQRYMHNLFQFVHVDDVARLIAYILGQTSPPGGMTILNVAGRGDPLPFAKCAEIAGARIVRLPGRAACGILLQTLWSLGISGIPPQALPYMIGSYTMDTSRLRAFLGGDYTRVIQYTVEEALRDCFAPATSQQEKVQAGLSRS
jgi:UDP-glucose 4-epimerase